MMRIKIKPSERLLEIVQDLVSMPDAPENIKSIGSDCELHSSDIRWCLTKIKGKEMPVPFHKILQECQVQLPEYKSPPRSPELEERIQRLRAEQSNREYQKMTQNVSCSSTSGQLSEDINKTSKELREMNRHLVTGSQYLLSVIGTFFAIFFASYYVSNAIGIRILLAIFCSLLVAIAEIYFIIRQDLSEEVNNKTKKN